MIARVPGRGMAKRTYDPNNPPNPATWLSLSEETRIEMVRAFHYREGHTHPPVHWTIHVIVENQAADPDLPTAAILARLQREGLTRHDAIHAVGTVLTESLYERVTDTTLHGEAANRRYYNALEGLTAESWLSQAPVEPESPLDSDEPSPPVRVGRNDPCPCGSGRKYKKCCGAVRQTSARSAQRLEWDDAIAALIRFANRDEFGEFLEASADTFLVRAAEDLEDRAYADEVSAGETDTAIMLWSLYDVEVEPDACLVDLFLRRKSRTLTSSQREYLEGMRAARMRLFEVVRVHPDEGFDLRDLLDGTTVHVAERLGTTQIVQWDVIAGRVRRSPGTPTFEGGLYLYPRDAKALMLRDLRRIRREAPSEDAFWRALPLWFHWRWVELTLMRRAPAIVTVEGDPVNLTRSLFKVIDAERLGHALDAATDLERDGDSWIWIEPATHRLLGTFRLDGTRLSVETLSRSRDRRACQLVTALAAGAIDYEGTAISDPTSSAYAADSGDDEIADADAEAAALVKDFYERHYREWIDTPVPALNGRTPRQAAADGRSRPRLVELLKLMENSAARAQLREGDAYDVSQLWSRLGLPRPE